MRIPLPRLLRHWREKEFEKHLTPGAVRWGVGLWSFFAKRPRLYRLAARIAARLLNVMGRGEGKLTRLPLANGWTAYRDMPAPQGRTFQAMWKERARG
jgi:L-lactate dehydrogenase complex protein LldF